MMAYVGPPRPALPKRITLGIGWTIWLIIKLSVFTTLCLMIYFGVQIAHQACTVEEAVDAMIVVPQIFYTIIVNTVNSL